MTSKIPWNKIMLDEFIELALLTDDEQLILKRRIDGWSICEQADAMHLSIATINRILKRIKIKYDMVQELSEILPPRDKL